MTDKDKQQAVGAAADALAKVEIGLEQIKADIEAAYAAIGVCYDAGVGKHVEAVIIREGIDDVKGKVSGALAKLLRLHRECTSIAIREGCDVPPTLAISGGLVKPESGGR